MSSLKDNFTEFLSEVEQMEKDNEKLTEDIQKLEKEQAEGWEKFNTDTHILLKRETLVDLERSVMDAKDYINDSKYDADEAANYSRNAYDQAEYAQDYIDEASSQLRDILREEEEVEG